MSKDKEIKNISVIEITVKDKDAVNDTMSCANPVIDADVEKAKVNLVRKGYEVLDTRVICCLSEVSYDKSITQRLTNKDYYIQDYSNGGARWIRKVLRRY